MRKKIGTTLLFWAVCLFFGLLLVHLLMNGHVSEEALRDVAKLRTAVADLDSLPGWVPKYPQLSFFAELVALAVPGISPGTAPFALMSLCGALLLAFAYRGFLRNGRRPLRAMLLTALLGAHPFFLWALTDSPGLATALIAYCLAFYGLLQLQGRPSGALGKFGQEEIRGYFIASFSLGAGFLSTPHFLFFSLGVFFVLPALISVRILRSAYYAVFFPVVITVLSVMYLGWVLLGAATPLATLLRLGFHRLPQGPLSSPWLLQYGDAPLRSLPFLVLLLALCFPAIAFCKREGLWLSFAVVLAASLATMERGIASPIEALIPVVSLLIVMLPRWVSLARDGVLVALLFIGASASWVVFPSWANQGQQHWLHALVGAPEDSYYASDVALGQWLLTRPNTSRLSIPVMPVMIDPETGFAVMAATQGRVKYLSSPEFQQDIHRGVLTAEIVAVPDPKTSLGALDSINRRFPLLYDKGVRGFTLVYSGNHWRVFRKMHEGLLDLEPETDHAPDWLGLLGAGWGWEKLACLFMALFALSFVQLARGLRLRPNAG